MVPNSVSCFTNKFIESDGNRRHRNRYIIHTTTMAKSKQDAIEERKKLERMTMERKGKNFQLELVEFENMMVDKEEVQDEDSTVCYDGGHVTTIGEYVRYQNPYLSFNGKNYSYVQGALNWANLHGILDASKTRDILQPSAGSSAGIAIRSVYPKVISEAMGENLRQQIKNAVVQRRNSRILVVASEESDEREGTSVALIENLDEVIDVCVCA